MVMAEWSLRAGQGPGRAGHAERGGIWEAGQRGCGTGSERTAAFPEGDPCPQGRLQLGARPMLDAEGAGSQTL